MTARASVVPGAGVVARLSGASVVGFPETPEQSAVLQSVLDLARVHGRTGKQLARRVAGLLAATEPEDVPPFAVCADDEAGVAVLVHGATTVSVTTADGTEELTGEGAATWVDRLVPGPVLRIVIGGDESADLLTDLVEGVVAGAGLVVDAADAELPDPTKAMPPVPEPDMPPEQRAFVIVSLEADDDDPAPEPLPAIDEPVVTAPSGRPKVLGISCARGHFNDPRALYCAACGISMVQQTHNETEGERPPLGVLVRDDGATFVVDRDYVIGRDPSNDDAVKAGEALPLVVEDPERTVSRVHARLVVEGWDVRIVDSGSVNGTFVAPPGTSAWARIPPEGSDSFAPGARLLVGSRTFVFESHHRS